MRRGAAQAPPPRRGGPIASLPRAALPTAGRGALPASARRPAPRSLPGRSDLGVNRRRPVAPPTAPPAARIAAADAARHQG